MQHLSKEDLRAPVVQRELVEVANNPEFPKKIRELAAKYVENRRLLKH